MRRTWLGVLLLITLLPTHLTRALAAAASETCVSEKNTVCTEAEDLLGKFIAKLELNPSCKDRFIEEAQQQYDRSFPTAVPRLLARVQGVSLTGTTDEIEFLHRMLRPKAPPRWQAAATQCADRDVKCAVGALFGSEEAAMRALSLAKDTSYLVSPSQERNQEPLEQYFTPEEIRIIDRTTRALPPKFHHLRAMNRFLRAHDDVKWRGDPEFAAFAQNNNGTPDSGIIAFYKGSFASGPAFAAETVVHELAHQYDRHWTTAPEHVKTGFAALSAWKHTGTETVTYPDKSTEAEKVYSRDPKAKFVRRYAARSPLEDFADSTGYYLAMPQEMKTAAPEKYELIRAQVFDGKEYLDNPPWQPSRKILNDPVGARLAADCIGRMQSIRKSKEPFFVEFDILKQGELKFDSFFKENRKLPEGCSTEFPDAVRAELERDPESCYKSPLDRQAEQASLLGGEILRDLLGGLPDFLKDIADSEAFAKRCLAAKDLRGDCAFQAYLEENSVARRTWANFDEASRKQVLETFASQLRLPLQASQKAFSPAGMVAECFSRQKKIRPSKEGPLLVEQNNSLPRYASQFLQNTGPECGSRAFEKLLRDGYRLPPQETWLKEFTEKGATDPWKKPSDRFVSAVLQESQKAFAHCAVTQRESCRQGAFRKILKSWGQAQGLSDEILLELGPRLYERLDF